MTAKIKIWSNGIPAMSKVVVVDDDGVERPIAVEGFKLESHADRPLEPAWLVLTACLSDNFVPDADGLPHDARVEALAAWRKQIAAKAAALAAGEPA